MFVTPTLQEVRERVESDYSTRTGVGPLLARSMLLALARTSAGADHLQHLHLSWNALQVLPDTADPEMLDAHAEWRGLTRKAAEFSEGNVDFSGVNGTNIPVGTEVQRVDGTRYSTDVAGVISGGVAVVAVTATVAGVAGDTVAASVVSLSTPVSGLDTDAAVAAGGLVGGEDPESDEDLRSRILNDYRNPPSAGTEADYATWALQVAGVTRAWGLPQHFGPGTVGLTFVVDDHPTSIVPDAAKIAEVQAYVLALRPVTAELTTLAPTLVPVAFQMTGIDTATQAGVTTSLRDLLLRDGHPGQPFLISRVREAISNTPGEVDHVLLTPAGDVTIAAAELPSFGGVIYV